VTGEDQDATNNVDTSVEPGADQAKRIRAGRFALELVAIVAAALLISFLIKTFVVQSFYVPSASMENTLQVNDRVLVPVWGGGASGITRGDVVVFRDPANWLDNDPVVNSGSSGNAVTPILSFIGLIPPDGTAHLVKRVIGLPGDTVSCCSADGHVVINGTPISEPYIVVPPQSRNAGPTQYSVTVPVGMLWVLGDNRYDSADSAYRLDKHDSSYFVPEKDVVGVAAIIDWPLDRWRTLDSYPALFATVGHPTPVIVAKG
jgi:signal peptidase I